MTSLMKIHLKSSFCSYVTKPINKAKALPKTYSIKKYKVLIEIKLFLWESIYMICDDRSVKQSFAAHTLRGELSVEILQSTLLLS